MIKPKKIQIGIHTVSLLLIKMRRNLDIKHVLLKKNILFIAGPSQVCLFINQRNYFPFYLLLKGESLVSLTFFLHS